MNKFTVRVYVATVWSMFSQGDHYEDYVVETKEPIGALAERLARQGFNPEPGHWVMPGAIVHIEQHR